MITFLIKGENMTKYDLIKTMNIDELAYYIRSECLSAVINGVVLDVDSIKRWLNTKHEGEINELCNSHL